jgi:ABC-type multidrug transport system ATPase subunit
MWRAIGCHGTIVSRAPSIISQKTAKMLTDPRSSGSGKSTLLNVLAHRTAPRNASVKATVYVNGGEANAETLHGISAYVGQNDALVDSLTFRETLHFAARLSLPKHVSKIERIQLIESLLTALGLQGQANNLIGAKGIPDGQKRRVSVAAQLITRPKLLFLDDPTSGLDSAASFEVISSIKDLAKKHNLIVVASMHQPSSSTFAMFDRLLLLCRGGTVYSGPISKLQPYFESSGFPIPLHMNPVNFIIGFVNNDLVNNDFANNDFARVHHLWRKFGLASATVTEEMKLNSVDDAFEPEPGKETAGVLTILAALVHRSSIKSYRDIAAFGIRIAIYMGLAVVMSIVWLRLSPTQGNIQSFVNANFFGGAFIGGAFTTFMAVAYIPSFLEDRAVFLKERANGLYGPSSFIIANFLSGVPYLFFIAILFSVVAYWLSNFQPTAQAFSTWVMWLFLDLLAAESLVVLVSSIVPISVVALAATAFANGIWMCTGGFLVPIRALNPFWRYVFHYVNHQSHVFKGMMVNELGSRNLTRTPPNNSGNSCSHMHERGMADQCLITSIAALDTYGYDLDDTGRWIGIMLGIIIGYRTLACLVLWLRRT